MSIPLLVKKTKFVDLDLNFSKHPVSKDISKKVDVNAITTSVRNLVMTRKFDRPFHPEISCQVMDLLFENFTPDLGYIIERTIKYVIENFEPRVAVIDVFVDETPDANKFSVTIIFDIIGTMERVTTTFFLDRSI
jgi:phage baseplate assembly protein W